MIKNNLTYSFSFQDKELKASEYPITDSIMKGVLIDGPITVALLSTASCFPGLFALPALSATAILLATSIAVPTASYSYYLREDYLEKGYGLSSYAIGGAYKYGVKSFISSYFDNEPTKTAVHKTILISALGIYNNGGYGACDSSETCESDTTTNIAGIFAIETTEPLLNNIGEHIFSGKDLNIIQEAVTGLYTSILASIAVHGLYVPAINPAHQFVDCLYDNNYNYDKASCVSDLVTSNYYIDKGLTSYNYYLNKAYNDMYIMLDMAIFGDVHEHMNEGEL